MLRINVHLRNASRSVIVVDALRMPDSVSLVEDERLFGWDPTPGIVSVWASRDGRVLLWQRVGGQIICRAERFRPWLLATTLADLEHLGGGLLSSTSPGAHNAKITYRVLDGPPQSFRYLISASDGRYLERTLLQGAVRRLGRRVTSLNDLQ